MDCSSLMNDIACHVYQQHHSWAYFFQDYSDFFLNGITDNCYLQSSLKIIHNKSK